MVGLVGDIGGTNVRLALSLDQGSPIGFPMAMLVRDFGHIADAIKSYFEALPSLGYDGPLPDQGVLAVAGPVFNNHINFTNNDWSFSGEEVAKTLGLGRIVLLNDYTAKALSLPDLSDRDYAPLGAFAPVTISKHVSHITSVLGPGTGLGVSALIADPSGRRIPLPTEGGHIGYAPETDEEVDVKLWLRKRFSRVSVERVLCGAGLVNVYEALCDIRALHHEADWEASDISKAALEGKDEAAVAALSLFCEILGSVAGDVALVHGVTDGVYIGGGIPPKILPFLQDSGFRRRFENKGRFRGHMESLYTRVITCPCPAQIGCAYHLWNTSET